jgi:predicted PurR-regulated permease PerM
LLASVITIVVLPMPQKLTSKGLPSWLSFVLTLLVVVGGLVAVVLLVVVGFSNITGDLSGPSTSLNQLSSLNPAIANLITGMISTMGNAVVQIGMVILIFVFMLSGALVTPSLNKVDAGTASIMTKVAELTEDVRRYMSIMTGVNFMVAVGDVILLWIVGVEYALVWGLLSWVMGYIPTVGFWIALIPPTLIAYSSLGTEAAVVVFLGYVLINGSVQNIIQPRMMGQGLGISTVVVFISLFIWGWLLGGIGAILAVPLTMIIMALLNSFPNTRWIAVLMSAPKSDKVKPDDHKNAHTKLGGLWDRTKHAIGISGGDQDDTADDTGPASEKQPDAPDNTDKAGGEEPNQQGSGDSTVSKPPTELTKQPEPTVSDGDS